MSGILFAVKTLRYLRRPVLCSQSVPGRMVLRLFDAPTWMCNASWHRATGNSPLSRDHYDDFASFCAAIAARYPDVTHYEVSGCNPVRGHCA